MTTQSADAIRLAVKLSGHTRCALWWGTEYDSKGVCDVCLGVASAIDFDLRLPEKHAALFAAQAVVDALEKANFQFSIAGEIDELREALTKLKTT